MADRRRIVTLSPGNRPVLEVDLEAGSTFQAIQGTFTYQPGQANQLQTLAGQARFSGQSIVGEQNANGTVSWQALVRGSTSDQVSANIESLLAAANQTAQGRLLEWRPDGNTYSSYFQIAGPGTWKPTYSWAQWQGAQSMVVDVSFPVRPLVDWDPMTIIDPFEVDSVTDYTFDALTSATVTFSTVSYLPNGSLNSERRARHTARGYHLLEAQATVETSPASAVPSNYKSGVLLRAQASTYVEVYVDDNGTNSRLRIDVVIAGTRTNRATTNLGSRISSSRFRVRGRIQGTTVYAEHFNNATTPAPMVAPTTSVSYTLSGGEQTSLVAGDTGWTWVPQNALDELQTFESRPFTYRNQATPLVIAPTDAIPGNAPALVDVLVTPSGGSATPGWALIGWAKYLGPSSLGSVMPIVVYDAESMSPLAGGWAPSVQAGALGGSDLRATTAGAVSYTAALTLQQNVEADDFTDGQLDIEVWARVLVTAGLVNPRAVVSAGMASSGGIVGAQYSEFGPAGRALVKPSSGTVYRFTRLGIVTVDLDGVSIPQLNFKLTADAGSTGAFGMDYVCWLPARRRAAGITGVAAASAAVFVPSTSEWTKRVRSDLSAALTEQPGSGEYRSVGLGGAPVQPSQGASRWLVKLSNLVPDDPGSDTTTEQLSHAATVELQVTPRSYMLRGG